MSPRCHHRPNRFFPPLGSFLQRLCKSPDLPPPRVSIIVPVYNTEPYLGKCLDSLINQTLPEIEIICVNDGSTDRSLDVLREYAARDARIRIIDKRQNEGLLLARKSGALSAAGTYILFVDSDDYLSPDACRTALDLMEADPVDILQFTCGLDAHSGNENAIKWWNRVLCPDEEFLSGDEILQDFYVKRGHITNLWGKLYSTDLCRKVYSHIEDFHCFVGEDVFQFFYFSLLADTFRAVQTQPLYWYRYGLGVSGHLTMPLSKFELYCKTAILCEKTRNFLHATSQITHCRSSYEAMSARLLQDCCRLYRKSLNEADTQVGMQLLFQHWRTNPIADTVIQAELGVTLAQLAAQYPTQSTPIPVDQCRENTAMLSRIKNLLKRILPPPVHAFNREIERILAAIRAQDNTYAAGLNEIRKGQAELVFDLTKQLRATQVELTSELTGQLRATQAELASELTEQLRVTQAEMAALQERFDQLFQENALLKESLDAQAKELAALRKEAKQHERNVIQKIDREKQEALYEYRSRLNPEEYEKELALWYRNRTGKVLNLQDPKTYNEKIQWLKLYDSTPLKTKLADKYLARDWVAEKIGEEYLIPLLGVWDSFDEIDFDSLPNQFVLKTNHGSGWNMVVSDKAQFNIVEAKKKFDSWVRKNFAFTRLELHYMNICPRIIAETYLENDAADLYDYKVFCFNGKAESIMHLCERSKGLKMAFFDLQWHKLPFAYDFPINPEEIPKPKNLDLLISLAEKLAEGFPHVRVDFYVLNDGSLKFGELTFSSANGGCRWNPPEQDRIYGDLIQLPPKSDIPQLKL